MCRSPFCTGVSVLNVFCGEPIVTQVMIYYAYSGRAGTWDFDRSRVELIGFGRNYSVATLNVARPDMNNYATLGGMLY